MKKRELTERLEQFLIMIKQKLALIEQIPVAEETTTNIQEIETLQKEYMAIRQQIASITNKKNMISAVLENALQNPLPPELKKQLTQTHAQIKYGLDYAEETTKTLADAIQNLQQEIDALKKGDQQQFTKYYMQEQQLLEKSKGGFRKVIIGLLGALIAVLSTGCATAEEIQPQEFEKIKPEIKQTPTPQIKPTETPEEIKPKYTWEIIERWVTQDYISEYTYNKLKQNNITPDQIVNFVELGLDPSQAVELLLAKKEFTKTELQIITLLASKRYGRFIKPILDLKPTPQQIQELIQVEDELNFKTALARVLEDQSITSMTEISKIAKLYAEIEKYGADYGEFRELYNTYQSQIHDLIELYAKMRDEGIEIKLSSIYWTSRYISSYLERNSIKNPTIKEKMEILTKLHNVKCDAYDMEMILRSELKLTENNLKLIDKLKNEGFWGDSIPKFILLGGNIDFVRAMTEIGLDPYAISICKERYKDLTVTEIKDLAKQANEQLNMKKFYRFKPADLKKLLENEKNQKEAPTLMLMSRSDWNFAGASDKSTDVYEQLLKQNPNTICYEIETETELFNYIIKTGSKYKISFLIILGHGSQKSISFGDADPRLGALDKGEEYSLGFEDEQELIDKALGNYLTDKAIIWNLSCSTAQGGKDAENIAKLMFKTIGKTIYASKTPFALMQAKLEFENGHVKKITIVDEENTVVFD